MTKEEFIDYITKYSNDQSDSIIHAFYTFLESNIGIPKGANRHPFADVLHAWIEGGVIITPRTGFLELGYETMPSAIKYLTDREYLIKPIEPVYEWQYAYDNGHGTPIISTVFYTDNEYTHFVDDKESCIKLEWTKRERK